MQNLEDYVIKNIIYFNNKIVKYVIIMFPILMISYNVINALNTIVINVMINYNL